MIITKEKFIELYNSVVGKHQGFSTTYYLGDSITFSISVGYNDFFIQLIEHKGDFWEIYAFISKDNYNLGTRGYFKPSGIIADFLEFDNNSFKIDLEKARVILFPVGT